MRDENAADAALNVTIFYISVDLGCDVFEAYPEIGRYREFEHHGFLQIAFTVSPNLICGSI
jgi:hypothetical protein